MSKLSFFALLGVLTIPTSAFAGVELELVTTDASGATTDRSTIFAQSEMIRIDETGAHGASMIFRGNEFLYLDHDEKSYMVMDQAMIDSVSSHMDAAMQQMQEQLANLPPDQRAMAEQMMKGQMQGMMGQKGDAAPAIRVEAAGRGEWQSQSCTNYIVYEGETKIQEVCAAESVPGTAEAMGAFRDMAAYIEKLTESLPMGAGDSINPGELMDQIDGFPVRTREFVDGSLDSEVVLESVVEKSLEAAIFQPPANYRKETPF